MLRIFLFIFICVVFLTGCALFKKQDPPFPKNMASLIESTSKQPIPSMLMGTVDEVESDGLTIVYESIGNPSNPTVLLIMGYNTTGLAWSPGIIQPMVDAGFHVIRFDNRDAGRSSKVINWTKKSAYTLSDMGNDALRILDKLNIEKAHILGISMGGMIGQTLAIEHPERLISLTSLATTGFYWDKNLPTVTSEVIWKNASLMAKYGVKPKDLKKRVMKNMSTITFLSRRNEITEDMVEFTTRKILFRDSIGVMDTPDGGKRHRKAMKKSGSRLEELKKVSLPVLVLHGTEDKLIVPGHAEKYAGLLPNKEIVMIEGMDHIPIDEDEGKIAEAFIQFVKELNLD